MAVREVVHPHVLTTVLPSKHKILQKEISIFLRLPCKCELRGSDPQMSGVLFFLHGLQTGIPVVWSFRNSCQKFTLLLIEFRKPRILVPPIYGFLKPLASVRVSRFLPETGIQEMNAFFGMSVSSSSPFLLHLFVFFILSFFLFS